MNAIRLPALLAALLCLTATLRAEAPASPPKQGEDLLKTDILGIFAHPDDETGCASTLARYALGQHKTVTAVYCTRGEGGGNMVGTQAGDALGVLREQELLDCLNKLGVRHHYFLDRTDFGYTENLNVTMEKWGHRETLRELVRIIRALRPEVIVTMNPAPVPGQHGHHQAAGMLALEAYDLAGDPTWFPEQLTKEGLRAWQTRKIYYGGPAGTGATLDVNTPLADGRTPAQIARLASANHRSQGFGGFANFAGPSRPPSFTLVKSVVPYATDETDLLRGLPVTGETPERLLAAGDGKVERGFEFHFVPRPAVDLYQRWVRAHQVEHVAETFATDVPVVAGEVSDVFVYAVNPSTNGVSTTVKYAAPPGWKLNFEEATIRFSPRRTNQLRVLVTPPPGHPADGELTAVTTVNGQELKASARLHPVPMTGVRRIDNGLPINADDADAAWAALPAQAIAFTNTWQGQAASAADCSGEFRLAHDGATLFVEVRVKDDVVVSNLAPNDIKGHWRSDSVELCLDPKVGAQHTFGCYKLGIVPFDSTGKVRAARDADARPGPVEETAPGTRLASWKTRDGYALRASIPFVEIGFKPTKDARRLGLNVLIYDGDKADAAPGENINKTRLAWAPRSGVQGRPEDWGRADFQ